MIKVSVLYPYSQESRFDHTYYRDSHMPLVNLQPKGASAGNFPKNSSSAFRYSTRLAPVFDRTSILNPPPLTFSVFKITLPFGAKISVILDFSGRLVAGLALERSRRTTTAGFRIDWPPA